MKQCCVKLNDHCTKDSDCCSDNCNEKKICDCAKQNKNKNLTDKKIRKAIKKWRKNKWRASKKYGNIEYWNVQKVTNMRSLFGQMKNFNQDIGCWNVSNVNDTSYMFDDAESFNHGLSRWNVLQVKLMTSMFGNAVSFNGKPSTWNVSNVTKWTVYSRTRYHLMAIFQDGMCQKLYQWMACFITLNRLIRISQIGMYLVLNQ